MLHQKTPSRRNYVRDLALCRESGHLRRELDALALLLEGIAGGSRDPINDWPGEAGEFLRLKGAFVAPMNVHAALELDHFVRVALACLELDDDLVVFGLPAWAKIGVLLERFGRHRQLNDHCLRAPKEGWFTGSDAGLRRF